MLANSSIRAHSYSNHEIRIVIRCTKKACEIKKGKRKLFLCGIILMKIYLAGDIKTNVRRNNKTDNSCGS